jgi:hypothetical protein
LITIWATKALEPSLRVRPIIVPICRTDLVIVVPCRTALPVAVVSPSCQHFAVRLEPRKYDNVVPQAPKWVKIGRKRYDIGLNEN